jgi:hypothetical protein
MSWLFNPLVLAIFGQESIRPPCLDSAMWLRWVTVYADAAAALEVQWNPDWARPDRPGQAYVAASIQEDLLYSFTTVPPGHPVRAEIQDFAACYHPQLRAAVLARARLPALAAPAAPAAAPAAPARRAAPRTAAEAAAMEDD